MIPGSYIFQQNYQKKKIDILCSDSIDDPDLEGSLLSDFQCFIQNVPPDFGETYFNMMDKILYCKNCSFEINKSLFYDHINSKRHRNSENYFIVKYMTFLRTLRYRIKK